MTDFKGYIQKDYLKLIEAEQLCEKIDFSINEDKENPQDYFATIYSEVVEQEMEYGTPVNEIFEILGEIVEEAVNRYIVTEKESAEGISKEVYEKMSFDFSVEADSGLSFTLNCDTAEYSVNGETEIKDIIGNAVKEAIAEYEKRL